MKSRSSCRNECAAAAILASAVKATCSSTASACVTRQAWTKETSSFITLSPDEFSLFSGGPTFRSSFGGVAPAIARVAPAIDRLTAEHAGADIVAVAHGGTIRAALAVALGLDPESALSFATETLSLTRLDHIADDRDGASWRVSTVNSRTGKTFERDP